MIFEDKSVKLSHFIDTKHRAENPKKKGTCTYFVVILLIHFVYLTSKCNYF